MFKELVIRLKFKNSSFGRQKNSECKLGHLRTQVKSVLNHKTLNLSINAALHISINATTTKKTFLFQIIVLILPLLHRPRNPDQRVG